MLQVDRKEIAYIQTPIESVGWEAMDSVTFHVTSPPSSLESQTFKIDISYENTGPEHNTVLLANTGKVFTGITAWLWVNVSQEIIPNIY